MPGTLFHEHLGVRWVARSNDGVTVELERRDDLCGPSGALEGGIVATLIDIAGASVSARALETGMVATEHIAVSYLAPGKVGPFQATGVILRTGLRDAVADVRVVDVGREDRLMAVAQVTVRKLEAR